MGCSVGFKYAKNALAAGALPQTPLGDLTTLPQTSVGEGDTNPNAPPPWHLRCLDSRAFDTSILVHHADLELATILHYRKASRHQ